MNRKRLLPILLILLGVGAIVLAVTADRLGISGNPGFGETQQLLAVFGFIVALIGGLQRYAPGWLRRFAVSETPVSSAQLLRMAVWFGLLTGLVEALMLVVQKWVLRIIINVNPHLFWMHPLASLIIFTIIGFILLLMAWRWPRVISLRLATCIFIFLGCLAPLFQFPQLYLLARVVLAAGLTVQISRLIAAHPRGFDVVVRRTVPWTVALAAAVGLSVYLIWKVVPEYRALAKLPPARPGAPNVLLIVLDTVRAESLSLYGYDRPTTPRLEEFAKTGICFERALSTSSWTLPSHATMFTGRFSHELFADWEMPIEAMTPVRATYPTLAEILSGYGYVTGGFVANVSYCSYAHGLNRGFAHYQDHVASPGLFLSCSGLMFKIVSRFRKIMDNYQDVGRKSAAEVNRAFLNWLACTDRRPFFAFLNYFDAHDPYLPPEPFDLKFGKKKPSIPSIRHNHKYTAREIQELQDAYDSCIAYLDHEIGSLLDVLQGQGVLENTVVIITSDHGEQFGEHGLMYHSNSLYRQLLHVPLLISFPKRVPAGVRVSEPVSLRDLPSTVVDLVGLEDEVRFPGSSLARYWNNTYASADGEMEMHLSEVLIIGKPTWIPKLWPVSKGGLKSLVGDGYHYIKNGDGREELYDFESDPEEARELIGSEEHQGALKRLKASLAIVLGSH